MIWQIIAWVLWTLVVLFVGIAVGQQLEKDKIHPEYQDGTPIPVTQNFNSTNFTEGINKARAETDGMKLDVLWEFYKSEDWKTKSILITKTEILWDLFANKNTKTRLQDALDAKLTAARPYVKGEPDG